MTTAPAGGPSGWCAVFHTRQSALIEIHEIIRLDGNLGGAPRRIPRYAAAHVRIFHRIKVFHQTARLDTRYDNPRCGAVATFSPPVGSPICAHEETAV
jgi:hypothetical protein